MSSVPICGDCGWQGKPTTPGRVAYSVKRHSCAAYRQLVARRHRGARARASVDRSPKPCLHKQAQHEHGTHACYVLDRCRCAPCAAANAAYERTRSRQTAYGRWEPLVDAQPVRDHVRALAAAGMGLKTVAARSDVAHGSLWKLMYGRRQDDGTRIPSRLVRRETASAILAVTAGLDDLAPRAVVDSTGTQRRVQALMAAGWSLSQQAAHLGVDSTNFPLVLRRGQVLAQTARAVRGMYAALANADPPQESKAQRIAASRARNYAHARGWQPPLWWDDEWLDDLSFDPAVVDCDSDDVDEVAIERAVSGRRVKLNRAEQREAVRQLDERGVSAARIAELIGVTQRTVVRFRAELRQPPAEGAA